MHHHTSHPLSPLLTHTTHMHTHMHTPTHTRTHLHTPHTYTHPHTHTELTPYHTQSASQPLDKSPSAKTEGKECIVLGGSNTSCMGQVSPTFSFWSLAVSNQLGREGLRTGLHDCILFDSSKIWYLACEVHVRLCGSVYIRLVHSWPSLFPVSILEVGVLGMRLCRSACFIFSCL